MDPKAVIHSAVRKNQEELTPWRAFWNNDELLRPHTFRVKNKCKQIYTVPISCVWETNRSADGGSAVGATRCVSRTPPLFWGVWYSLLETGKPLMGKKEWNSWLLHCRKITVAGHCPNEPRVLWYILFWTGEVETFISKAFKCYQTSFEH